MPQHQTTGDPLSPSNKKHKPWVGFLVVVVGLVLVLLGFFGYGVAQSYLRYRSGALNLSTYATNQITKTNATSVIKTVSRSQIETADDPSLGPADALVTIVEFGDFECPFCQTSFPIIKDILATYGNRIRFIFRDFPNPSLHPNALPAALAASCANDQGKFWQYHDLLYLNSSSLTEDLFTTLAQQTGLNVAQYQACYSSQRHLQEILDDYNAGITAGVTGTPTWFVNGNRIPGVIPLADFKKIIDLGLAGKL